MTSPSDEEQDTRVSKLTQTVCVCDSNILFTRETFYDSEMIGAIYLSDMSKVGSLESANGHQLLAYLVSISGSIVENSILKAENLRDGFQINKNHLS